MNSTFNETAMNSILQYIVALLGNPGTGKSTLGNCIAGKNDDGSLPFESGLSYGSGKIVRNPVSRGHRRIVDLPGFADVDKTRNTGLEIADIINKELFIGEAFVKLIFVVDLKNGRVMPEDLATMVTILTAVQEALHDKTVEVKYSVIVNQVKKKQFRELKDRNGDAFRKVYASLQIGKNRAYCDADKRQTH
ncbi:hypothetical protein HDU99_004184 [Rhizoclosmatium hyalinum]|nr:hypothetical protein HDU99_004184 [Rhizoclosmatium hyalinum]